MKKERGYFNTILVIWLVLFNVILVTSVITKHIIENKGIIVTNPIIGNTIYYSATREIIFTKFLIPLIIYNVVMIFLLSLSFNYYHKIKKKRK